MLYSCLVMLTLPHALSFLIVALAAMPLAPRAATAQQRANEGCASATGPDEPSTTRDTTRRDSTAAATRRPSADRIPDVRILASVSAQEVRFAKQPQICVRLRGDARLDSVRVVGRKNLSSPVVSGTTYRDVYVAVEILGHLNATCIASRITRTPTDSATTAACASLEVNTGGRRSSAPP